MAGRLQLVAAVRGKVFGLLERAGCASRHLVDLTVCEHEAMQRRRLTPFVYGALAFGTGVAGLSELSVETRVACLVVAGLLSGAAVVLTAPEAALLQK